MAAWLQCPLCLYEDSSVLVDVVMGCCCCYVTSVVSDSVRPHRRQPTRLLFLGFSRQEYWSKLPFPSPVHESKKWKWSISVMSDSSWPHGPYPMDPMKAHPSMGFPRQENWSGVPLPSPSWTKEVQIIRFNWGKGSTAHKRESFYTPAI